MADKNRNLSQPDSSTPVEDGSSSTPDQNRQNCPQKDEKRRKEIDPLFPSDAIIIANKEILRFKEQEMKPFELQPILNRPHKNGDHLILSNAEPKLYDIGSNVVDGKKLAHCPTRRELHKRLQQRLGGIKTKPGAQLKAEKEMIDNNSAADFINPDTEAPLSLTSTPTPEIMPAESLFRKAQDSWKEKKSRFFGNSKKDSDSDSSSRRRNKPKKKLFGGGEKEQNSDRKLTNSDKSLKQKKGNDFKKADDSSGRKKKNASEKNPRSDAASGREKKRGGGEKEQISDQKLTNSDKSLKQKKVIGSKKMDDFSDRKKENASEKNFRDDASGRQKKRGGGEKEQISDSKQTNSDKSLKQKKGNDFKKTDDSSDRKKKNANEKNFRADAASGREKKR